MRPFRLLPVLLAVALASCEGGGPNGDGLPPLREGFTYLKRVGGVVRNAAMEGFNTDAVGLAVSGDGSRVAALVMAGQFFQTFTTTTVYDWGSGSYRTELGGGTSTNTWFTFHLSEDGGATWRELPLRPAMGAPTGWTSGIVLAGDRAFTVVEGPSGWHVVEIDTETGIYRPVEVRYPDGNLWAPLIYHARAFSGSIVSVHVPLDTGYVAAWRGNLATGEASVYRDDNPACIPMGVTNGQRPELFVPTSASTIQGICNNRRDEVCWFTWDLRDDAPFTTPLQIVRCAPGDEFTHPSSLAIEGVVPEFTPVAALPTAGGLHVVGRAVYATEGHERVWTHAVALSFREDGGPPYTVDLGPGDIIENDFRFLRPQRGGFALVTPDCGERPTDGTTGACIGESLPGAGFDRPTLVGWDPSASAFGPVSLSPSPCVDPNACFAVPDRLVPAGDGRYLATFRVHTGGLHGEIERGLAIGFVYAPWYEPPASLEPEPATPLEMRCWAELECDPISRLQPTGTLLERVRTCIERWRLTRGAPTRTGSVSSGPRSTTATACAPPIPSASWTPPRAFRATAIPRARSRATGCAPARKRTAARAAWSAASAAASPTRAPTARPASRTATPPGGGSTARAAWSTTARRTGSCASSGTAAWFPTRAAPTPSRSSATATPSCTAGAPASRAGSTARGKACAARQETAT